MAALSPEAVTALIITFDEKENISRTLTALRWVPQVLLIDSFSTDGTVELAQGTHPNVRAVQRPFESFASQCNFGLSLITTEWVLSIDADYILTDKLAAEIQKLQPNDAVAGYEVQFNYCVFGRRLPTTIYPPRAVLYRPSAAKYFNDGHGHKVQLLGPVLPLAGKIDHDDRKPLSRWIRSQDGYAKVEAPHLRRTPDAELSRQDRLRKRIYFAAPLMFLYLLLGQRLVLGGWPAWYYVCQRTIAELLLSLRLLTEKHALERSDELLR